MAIGQALHVTDAETLGRLDLEGALPEPGPSADQPTATSKFDLAGVSGHRIE